MSKSYEQLKGSYALLNALQEDFENKNAVKEKVEARYQGLKAELDQAKEQRKAVFEKKLLGQATYNDVEQLDSKLQALEKEMVVVAEELEVVKTYPKKPLHDEDTIYKGHREFLDEYCKNELPPFEEELKAAKEAYMEKLNAYIEAREKAHKVGSEIFEYMAKFGWKSMYYGFPKLPQPNKDILVNPKYLEDTQINY